MSRRDLAFWGFVFLCIFLFQGTPDIWDKLHAKVMAELTVKGQ